jgi:hypothetical protein
MNNAATAANTAQPGSGITSPFTVTLSIRRLVEAVLPVSFISTRKRMPEVRLSKVVPDRSKSAVASGCAGLPGVTQPLHFRSVHRLQDRQAGEPAGETAL